MKRILLVAAPRSSSCTPLSGEPDHRAILAVVLVVLVVSPSVASAGTVRPWLGAHGSLATYRMSDVNSDVNNFNAHAWSGLQMDEIHGGLGVGAAFGLDLPGRVSVGLGYEHLYASSDVGDASGSLKFDLPANAFRGFLQYSFAGVGPSGAYLGGSLGIVSESGSVLVPVVGCDRCAIALPAFEKRDIKGSGGLFELFAGGDWWAAVQVPHGRPEPVFALSGMTGYRYAKIGETKVNETVYLANGEKESIDYSGVFARVGFKVAL